MRQNACLQMKHLHVSRNGSGMWHFREAEEPNFPKVLDLLQHYIGKSDSKVMLRYQVYVN